MLKALSSSLLQRYNIFRRNANRVNISQHFAKCLKTSFAHPSLCDVLYYEARFGGVYFDVRVGMFVDCCIPCDFVMESCETGPGEWDVG